MKNFNFRLVLAILMTLIISTPAFATQIKATKETIDLCSSVDIPSSVDNAVFHLFKEIGCEITITITGNRSGLNMVNSGVKDGHTAGVGVTKETYPNIIEVPNPLFDLSYVVYARSDFSGTIRNWDDLIPYRVGHVFQKPHLETSLPQTIKSVIQKPSRASLFDALENGEIDLAVITIATGQSQHMPEGLKFVSEIDKIPVHIVLNEKHSELVQKLSNSIAVMKANGTLNKLLNNESLSQDSFEDTDYILHVQTNNPDSTIEKEILKGVQSKNFDAYKFYTAYLDSNQKVDKEVKSQNIQGLIRADFLGKIPKLVLITGNSAFKFMVDQYSILFYGVPVVFTDVIDYKPSDIAGIEKFVSGSLGQISAAETMDVMLKLFPKTKNIFVINDYTESGRAWHSAIEKQMGPYLDRVTIESNQNLSTHDLLENLKNLPPNTLVLVGDYQVDKSGVYYSPSEIQSLLYKNSSSPIFGLSMINYGFGHLGGKYIDYEAHGKLAADIMTKILDGADVSSIGIVPDNGKSNAWFFDAAVMKRWHISKEEILNLFVDATITNQELSLLESNPLLFWLLVSIAFIILMSVCGSFWFLQTLRKRNANLKEIQKNLYSTEQLLEKDDQLKLLKENLEQVMETAPIGYALVVDDFIVEGNPFLNEIMGIPREQRVSEIPLFSDFPDTYDANGQDSFGFKMPDGTTHKFMRSIGKTVYKEKDATVFWFIDIEESEKQSTALQQFENELAIILDHLPMPLIISSKDEVSIRYINNKSLEVFDLDSRPEMIDKSWHNFIQHTKTEDPANSVDFLKQHFAHADDTDYSLMRECQYITKKGRIIDAIVFDMLSYYKGEMVIVSIINDISNEKQSNELLQKTAEKEHDNNKLKSRFLVNMSHEIRSPMNAIIGLSELQVMKAVNGEVHDSIRKINQSAKSLLDIINDILDYSKLEANKLELLDIDFDLEEMLAEIIEALPKDQIKSIEVGYSIDARIPTFIRADRVRLKQALTNLLNNAVTHTNTGGVEIDVELIKRRYNSMYLSFSVLDTGIGMSSEQLKKATLPFEQFSYHLNNSGTGLGLPIVKSITELMGGTFNIDSELGRGTEITFTANVRKCPASYQKVYAAGSLEERRLAIQSTPKKEKSLKGAKILVVDDVEMNQEVALSILEHFEVIGSVASSGEEALKILSSQNFDIILMDVNMPGMDGYETTREIRRRGIKTPIIAMTGNTDRDDIVRCINSGMDSHLQKPIIIDDLKSVVSSYLPD